MRRLLSILVCLTWSLWFGGQITLFIAVTSLFRTFERAKQVAGNGAAGIFHDFERYQLVLAAIGLTALFLWYLMPARPKSAGKAKIAMFTMMALAALGASLSTILITPKIDAMRLQNETAGPEFGKLHGISMSIYLAESGLLLLAGLLLPTIIARDGNAK